MGCHPFGLMISAIISVIILSVSLYFYYNDYIEETCKIELKEIRWEEGWGYGGSSDWVFYANIMPINEPDCGFKELRYTFTQKQEALEEYGKLKEYKQIISNNTIYHQGLCFYLSGNAICEIELDEPRQTRALLGIILGAFSCFGLSLCMILQSYHNMILGNHIN